MLGTEEQRFVYQINASALMFEWEMQQYADGLPAGIDPLAKMKQVEGEAKRRKEAIHQNNILYVTAIVMPIERRLDAPRQARIKAWLDSMKALDKAIQADREKRRVVFADTVTRKPRPKRKR